MKETLTFDIETTGLTPQDSIITCICALDSFEVEFRSYGENELKIIEEFITFLKSHSPETTILITHNGRKFDIPFIIERCFFLNGINLLEIFMAYEHFDSIEIVQSGKWIKLDELADIYALPKKSGNGLFAIQLFREERYEELVKYCMDDVYLTENVAKIYFKLQKRSSE